MAQDTNENEAPESQYISCNNFIELEKIYLFNDAGVYDNSTVPVTVDGYGKASLIFHENSLTIDVGNINETYSIEKASYETKPGHECYFARFVISKGNEVWDANFFYSEEYEELISQSFEVLRLGNNGLEYLYDLRLKRRP